MVMLRIMEGSMQLPDYVSTETRKGKLRARYRRGGVRILLRGEAGSAEMWAHYNQIVGDVDDRASHMTFGDLVEGYLEHLDAKESTGAMSLLTVSSRRHLLTALLDEFGGKSVFMPRRQVFAIRDRLAPTPGKSDNTVKALKAMYNWAIDMEIATSNPCLRVPKLTAASKGHTPWTAEEITAYLSHHEIGSTKHITLALALTTAARVSDLVRLGPDNLVTVGGRSVIRWMQKKGGFKTAAQAPMTDLLLDTLAASPDTGPTFLLTKRGKSFTWKGLPNHFRRWADEVGVQGKSLHGIRKFVGHAMAEAGATEYEIMSLMGHTDPATSAVYTRGANRISMAVTGGDRLSVMLSAVTENRGGGHLADSGGRKNPMLADTYERIFPSGSP